MSSVGVDDVSSCSSWGVGMLRDGETRQKKNGLSDYREGSSIERETKVARESVN
jgi:hypothetical protein